MPTREIRRCCTSLIQAIIVLVAMVFLTVYFRPLAEGKLNERFIQIGQNVIGVVAGAQLAVVVFRWRVLREQDKPN